MKRKIVYTIILFFVLFIGGCNSRGISVTTVTGEVTYNGTPVENALISFVPQTPNGRGASGQSESNGAFVLLTQGATQSGAMLGEYKVLVSKVVEIDSSGKEVKRELVENYDPVNPPQQKMYPQKNLLPEKYSKEDSTEFTVTVEKGKNHFKLALKD
ncbi:MAG: hypothetical protein LBJ67_12475 [Planctomycetaceae bacterium]|jgi:hypothetical protein|nr:hypothetical protein [Planctomycetaceae bacterium]